ncbi:hypothetical protein [Nocardia pseudobrasiliensis]|uniref:Uncharacterized protein n=1 Tax=Nocardia pseudobrasiliensis TaxID=45979 RepID=A0A370HPS3_9NOCA|nr:hypothetical protein [Nocardia pseudobrasiliensis]RDI60467.1 hypothetical protein DFR76_11597 [Nocardia pseudobrasiliensis]
MPYYARVPDETRKRLAELATLLRACRDACVRIGEDHHWAAHPDSVCAADLAALADSAYVRDHRLVLEAVATYLELAAAHCGGLAGLCDTCEIVASPWPLTRSILESCARASWILGSNPPTEPTRNRLARAYIDNDLSAEYDKKIIQYLHGKQSPTYRAAKDRFDRLRTEISTVFPETSGEDFNTRTINGQICLGPTDTVLWFFDLLATAGSPLLEPKAPTAIYDLLSTHTHPTLASSRHRRTFIDHGDHVGTVQIVQPENIEWLTRLAVMAMYDVLSLVYRYCGWWFDSDGKFGSVIDQTLPDFLRR